MQNRSNKALSNQGPPTAEGNNLPIIGPSSESWSAEPNTNCNRSMQFKDLVIRRGTAKTEATNVDMELMAEKRGHAMLRYKEKKKNRRYIWLVVFFYYCRLFILLFCILRSMVNSIYSSDWWEKTMKPWTDMISTSATNQGRPEPTQESEWRVGLWRQVTPDCIT